MKNTKAVDRPSKQLGAFGSIFHRFRKNRVALVGLVMFIIILFFSFSASLFVDYDADAIEQQIYRRYQSPSAEHLMGTDSQGRDVLARVMFGARLSLIIAFSTVLGSSLFGMLIGSACGYFGGWFDNVIMRINDVLMAIPSTLLAVTVVAALGTSIYNLIIALMVALVPPFSRIVRSSVLQVKSSDYIEAAKAYGSKHSRIIITHVIPNSIGPIIVQATLNLAGTLLSVAALGFVGLGVPRPIPEWGTMLSEARADMLYYPHLIFFPACAIVLTVLSINLIGDGLRDALDPRLKN